MRRWWSAVLLAVASCGGSDSDGPSDMSPEGVCTYYAGKMCAADEHCSGGFQGFWSDAAICKERAKLSCTVRLSAAGVNDTASRVVACANALPALSCDQYDDFDRWPETCFPPPGQLADGAPCIVPGQCQGSACNIRSTMACGVCATVSRAGGACSDDLACFNFMPCVDGICAPHPRTGETCDTMSDRYCVADSVCKNVDAMGIGTCGLPAPQGAACDPLGPGGGECDFWHGYYCDEFAKICKSAPPLPKIGERCESDVCAFVAYCAADLTCKVNPREGQPCIPGEIDCLTPARCIGGVCRIRDAAVCK